MMARENVEETRWVLNDGRSRMEGFRMRLNKYRLIKKGGQTY